MNQHVYIKLITGDQVMASLMYENEYSVVISFPISLKSMPQIKDGMVYERLMTQEFCSFTDDKEFELKKKDILIMKTLKDNLSEMYQRTIDELYIIGDNQVEDLDTEDTPEQELEENTDIKKTYH